MKRYWKVCLSTLLLLPGCTRYYLERNLNSFSPGVTTAQFASTYPQQGRVRGTILRASRVIASDTIQVYTLPMMPEGGSKPIDYWFVFKNGRLAQWGRPEDWKNVAATYQIDFNPAPSVRPPD